MHIYIHFADFTNGFKGQYATCSRKYILNTYKQRVRTVCRKVWQGANAHVCKVFYAASRFNIKDRHFVTSRIFEYQWVYIF